MSAQVKAVVQAGTSGEAEEAGEGHRRGSVEAVEEPTSNRSMAKAWRWTDEVPGSRASSDPNAGKSRTAPGR